MAECLHLHLCNTNLIRKEEKQFFKFVSVNQLYVFNMILWPAIFSGKLRVRCFLVRTDTEISNLLGIY